MSGSNSRLVGCVVRWKYPAWGVQTTRTEVAAARGGTDAAHFREVLGGAPAVCLYEGGEVMGGASKACLSRLQKEYQRLGKEPVPNVVAEPK